MADQVQRTTDVTRGSGSGSPLRIFKPGQGKWVRWCTVGGTGALALAGAGFLSEQMQLFQFAENEYIRFSIPVVFLLLVAYGVYYLVGRHEGAVNFLIATEGEMKKVNWSTRKEVMGATRVVIFTVISLSLILFVVDIIFMVFFSGIGVLRINVIEKFFGGST